MSQIKERKKCIVCNETKPSKGAEICSKCVRKQNRIFILQAKIEEQKQHKEESKSRKNKTKQTTKENDVQTPPEQNLSIDDFDFNYINEAVKDLKESRSDDTRFTNLLMVVALPKHFHEEPHTWKPTQIEIFELCTIIDKIFEGKLSYCLAAINKTKQGLSFIMIGMHMKKLCRNMYKYIDQIQDEFSKKYFQNGTSFEDAFPFFKLNHLRNMYEYIYKLDTNVTDYSAYLKKPNVFKYFEGKIELSESCEWASPFPTISNVLKLLKEVYPQTVTRRRRQELNLQKKLDYIEKQIEEVKSNPPQTIINNITNNSSNIINNNNNNTTNNYNNSLKMYVNNLKPITNEKIVDVFKEVINSSLANHHVLNGQDLSNKLTHSSLIDHLLTSDASRGIAHWKDGDKEDEHIRDEWCKTLATKMFNISIHTQQFFQDYVSFIDKELKNFDHELQEMDYFKKLIFAKEFLTNISKNVDQFEEVGKQISKSISPALREQRLKSNKLKEDSKFLKLKECIRKEYVSSPYLYIIQEPESIAVSLKFACKEYIDEDHKNPENMFIKDDNNKFISIPGVELAQIIRDIFKECDAHKSYSLLLLSKKNQTMFSKYMESLEKAQENYDLFERWIGYKLEEEEIEQFNNKLLQMFKIN
jgi:hypothetical protein